MIEKKILGLFKALPLESIKIKKICEYTNTEKDIVEKVLKKLVKDGHIKGKLSYKLCKVPIHVKNIPK